MAYLPPYSVITTSAPSKRVSPFKDAGVPGFAVYSGYLLDRERNPKLSRGRRYETFADILANTAIVGAGVRFWQALVSRPSWTVSPAYDINGDDSSDEAKEAAEFVQSVIDRLGVGWSRQIKKASSYRLYGFYTGEWTASKRDDGLIGMANIEPRAQWTIERWHVGDTGDVEGVWQRSPQTGQELYIPRSKLIYLVDDALTDSPEGMGVLRQIAETSERLKEYLRLEGQGFERDLRGIPFGRAPIAEINELVKNGTLTEAEGKQAIEGFMDFTRMQAKEANTGLVVDSQTYPSQTSDGQNVSPVRKWDMELLSAQSSGLSELGTAIDRCNFEIARVLGVEGLLLGQSTGSRALSEDKSSNLYLQAEAALADIAEAFERDFIGPLWTLNGFDPALKPTLEYESVAPKDIEAMIGSLERLARAGVIMDRDDAAIKEAFGLIGLTAPEADAMLADMSGAGDDPLEGLE